MEKQKTGLHQGLGIGSLVVGIIALLISFIPCLGQFAIFVAPVAILMGLGGYYLAKSTDQSSGLNLGGIIISLIAFYVAWWQLTSLNDATNYMNKSMGGKGDNSIGYLQVIITVVVIGIIVFINYTKGKKNNNQSIVRSNTDTNPTENPSETVSTTSSTTLSTISNSTPINFDFQEFFQKNLKAIIAAAAAIIIGIAVWFFFIKANPEGDAKKVAKENCNCTQSYTNAMTNVDTIFLNAFDSYKFTTQNDARDKLKELQQQAENSNTDCIAKAQALYAQLRAAYVSNPELLSKFDLASATLQGSCGISGMADLSSLTAKIDEKIQKIIDPIDYSLLDPNEAGDGGEPIFDSHGAVIGYNTNSGNGQATYDTEQEVTIASAPVDEFEGSSLGSGGFKYVSGKFGQCAELPFRNKGAVYYFNAPNEGTITFWVNVRNGYIYNNYQLNSNPEDAYIFTNTGSDNYFAGSTWIRVWKNGDISFNMATSDGGRTPAQEVKVRGTKFRFNEWHQVGISFGSKGQSLYLDGKVIGQAAGNNQTLGVFNRNTSQGRPTFGYYKSIVFPKEQYDLGFEGLLDNVKISSAQNDW